MEALINKYRPQELDQVVGQEDVIKSIQIAMQQNRGRAFLLSGPSGVGKTTIARIIPRWKVGSKVDLLEVDGATATGIDSMREITAHLKFKSIGGGKRAIIVDECHAISAQAFKSILKNIEEPPEGVYWILCTTEYAKVPKEIKTRCLDYKLKPVSTADVRGIIKDIARKERMPVARSSEALDVIAEMSEGSPRQAISMLAQCGHLRDAEEIEALCSAEASSKEAIDICRLLMKGANFKQLASCISNIQGSPESVRIIVLRYMTTVALKKPNPQKELAIMDEFSEPFQDREGKAPILLACARLTLGD